MPTRRPPGLESRPGMPAIRLVSTMPAEQERREPGRRSSGTIMVQGALLADRFRLIEQVGEGGMGRVWRALHVGLGREVALKVLHHDRHRNDMIRERFRREALATGALSHPGIVRPVDFGALADGRDFLAMEYVDGRTFQQLVRAAGPIPWRVVVRLGLEVCEALAHAHDRGVIHRDLKPANLMVEGGGLQHGRARVLDFGIARLVTGPASSTLTTKGMVLGTPTYSAPEQLRGDPADLRADVYGLGASFYYALTGRPPYAAGSLPAIVTAQAEGPPPHPAEAMPDPTRPRMLDELVLAMMARDPFERPRTIREVADRLAAVPHAPPPRQRSSVLALWLALGGLFVLCAGAVAGAATALLLAG